MNHIYNLDTEKEYSDSHVYHYAGNNPIRYTDPDGSDVVVLNRSYGAGGFGHNAIMIGNDSFGWTFFSKDDIGKNTYSIYPTFFLFLLKIRIYLRQNVMIDVVLFIQHWKKIKGWGFDCANYTSDVLTKIGIKHVLTPGGLEKQLKKSVPAERIKTYKDVSDCE